MPERTEPERIPIMVRAYGKPQEKRRKKKWERQGARRLRRASAWSLTFDTETLPYPGQPLWVGGFQVRQAGALKRAGFFYDPDSLARSDLQTLRGFASERGLEVLTRDEFVEDVFFPILVDLRGTAITYNGAFDYARLAIDHGPALSASYRGGFWLAFNRDPRRPHLQVRHLSGAECLMRFTEPDEQPTPRGMRNRGLTVPVYRGFFSDVRALAVALLEHRGDLRSLAKLLGTPAQKGEADFEATELSAEFLAYSIDDVQVTWECYEWLAGAYARLSLDTPLHSIYSAASIGKAQLDAMGIRPWRQVQPDFPDDLVGLLMATYYGGRSEVNIRRAVWRVIYADFLSMYPSCCVLLGLWRFLVADGIVAREATAEVRSLMDQIAVDDLQQPGIWRQMTAIVQLEAAEDLLPIRGTYGDSESATIGLNFLSSDGQAMWYALPDVVNAKVRGGRVPRVLRAIAFEPGNTQNDLKPVDLMGDPAYRIDPATDDVVRRLIELRSEIKARAKNAALAGRFEEAERLEAEQTALKIEVNALYGIAAEFNVTEWADPHAIEVFGRGEPYLTGGRSTEEPGRLFHPLLATLMTSAARLLLGLAERQILDRRLDWVFCDTDSMAIAKPPAMSERTFRQRARAVLDWFEPLKPYAIHEPLFKIEKANFALDAEARVTEDLAPLYCFAVSDKRYVLFNIDASGRPVLRKASAHGLGHLRPPYGDDTATPSIPAPLVGPADLGVTRWQHDFWYRIVEAALEGHPAQVRLDDLPGFDAPAHSRYAATTPSLLHWFDAYNAGKPYRDQVRPFGFLSAFHAKRDISEVLLGTELGPPDESDAAEPPAVVAPFSKDPLEAVQRAFDRHTGRPVPVSQLMSLREALAQYHLHPEMKFAGGDYLDVGTTRRRHVAPLGPIRNIGKEANRWEEQAIIGSDPAAQVAYGASPGEFAAYCRQVAGRAKRFSVRALAERARISIGTVSTLRRGLGKPRLDTVMSLDRAVSAMEFEARRMDAGADPAEHDG